MTQLTPGEMSYAIEYALRHQDDSMWQQRSDLSVSAGDMVRVVSGSYKGRVCQVVERVGFNGSHEIFRLRSGVSGGPYAPLSANRLVKLLYRGKHD